MNIRERGHKRGIGNVGVTAVTPEYARIPTISEIFGLSRSGIYKLAAEGKIEMVKDGGASLVSCASVREYLASLPRAAIGTNQKVAA